MADPRQEWKTRTDVNEFRKRPSRSPSLTYGETPKRPPATTQQQASGPPPKNVGGPPTATVPESHRTSPVLRYGQTPERPLATTQQETTAPRPKDVGATLYSGPPASRTREQQVEPPQLGRSMSTGLDDYDINWLNGGQQQELQQNGSVYLFGQHWIADPTNPEKLTPRGY
jgi:hypothetical protein